MSALGSIGVVSARGLAVGAAGGAGAIAGLAGAVGTSAAVSVSAGALFGLAYGTAIRVGYEQIYPFLFPPTGDKTLPVHTQQILSGLEKMYDLIGGKAAHIFGIEQGVQARTQGTQTAPDYTYVPQDQPNILQSIDEFFKTLTSQVASVSFNVLPSAHATDAPGAPGAPAIELTIEDKEFLISQINQLTSIEELMRRRRSYTDLNLIQVIDARIRYVRANNLENQSTLDTKSTLPPPPPSAARRDATADEIDFNVWNNELFNLINRTIILRNTYNSITSEEIKADARSKHAALLGQLRQISNDYRNPNAKIQKRVIQLRQELANNAFS